MASTAAFNALLKVVEEPPGHVLFAMATTDPQKVLPTIMSRVQRLDLRRVTGPDLTGHLRHLGEVEGFTLDDEAAAGVVAAGDGSVRDTLSVLEQVLAFAADDRDTDGDGNLHVTGEHVTRVLGATPFELTAQVVDAIADTDVAAALAAVQGLLDGGHDLRRFSLDLARHLRDLLVLAAAPGVDGLVDTTAERRERLEAQAGRFGTDTLVRAVELVGEVLVEQRQGPPRLPLELAIARLATPGADGDVLALADRVSRLEKAVNDGAPVPAPAADGARPTASASTEAAPPAAAEASERSASAQTPEQPTHDQPDGPEQPASAEAPEQSLQEQPDEPEAGATGTALGAQATTDASGPAAGAADEQPSASDEQATDPAPTDAPAADGAGPGEAAGAAAAAAAATTDADAAAADADAAAADADTAEGDAAGADPAEGDADAAGADAAEGDADAAGDDAATLADRAARLADESKDRPPPAALEKRPGTTTVERDPVEPAPSGGDKLEQIASGWEQILDVVGDASRRAKAFYEPATPARLGKGVLLLRYPADKRFHAEQGKSGEMTAHLATAVEQVTGLERIKVDVQLSDEGPRRPSPPEVAGGATDDDEPSPAEVAAVAEVERAPEPSEAPDEDEVDQLLRTELGAHKLDDV